MSGCSPSGREGASTSAPAPVAAAAPLPVAGTYAIDPVHTFVSFAAQHKVVGRVLGRFERMTGVIIVAQDPAACSVDVSIEAGSISTQNGVRDEDLRGPDFFDAARFPTISFQGRGIRSAGDAWVMDGTLTIRGTAKAVPLSFSFTGVAPAKPNEPSRIALRATAAVKRADLGMTRELLDEIGAESASPDVWIEIDTELLAATPVQP